MIRTVFAATVLLFACFIYPTGAAALPLNTGESVLLEFSDIPFTDNVSIPNQGGASINLGSDLLDAGETARLELFEDDISSLIFQHDFTNPTDHFGFTGIVPTPWQDLQGVVRVTMLNGSITLDNVQVFVIRDGERFDDIFRFASVSEPAPLALLALGLAGLLRLQNSRPKFR